MSQPKKYRKKPVAIEAMRLTGTESATAIINWTLDQEPPVPTPSYVHNGEPSRFRHGSSDLDMFLIIPTLEGPMRADRGDYIIRGVNGEFYPCKPDIFAKTYEEESAA